MAGAGRIVIPAAPGALTAGALWAATLPNTALSRDGGVFAYIGSRVLNGDLPLRDLWDHKPPGVYYVDAFAFFLGRPDLKTLFLLDLVFSLAFVLVMAWALSRIISAWTIALVLPWLALMTRVFLENSTNFTEQFALVPMALSLGCGLTALQPQSKRQSLWAFGCCFAAGVASLFKPTAMTPGIALLGAFIAMLWIDRRAALSRVSLGLAALVTPLVATAAAYGAAGGLPSLWDTVVVYNRLYAPHLSLSLLAIAGSALVAQPLLIPAPIGSLLVLIAWLRGWQPAWLRPPLIAFSVFLPALDLVGLIAQGRFYLHDMVLLLPSFGLLAAAGLECYVGPLRAPLNIRWQSAVAAGLAGGVFLMSYPLLLLNQAATPSGMRQAQAIARVAETIGSACPRGASVYVWGAESEIYFLSERRSASRYSYLYPLQMPGYNNQRRVADLLTDLQTSKPCAIVDASAWNDLVPPLLASPRERWRPSTSFGGAYSYDAFQSIYVYVAQNYAVNVSKAAAPVMLRR